MAKTTSIEDFYKGKFDWVPDNLKKEIGHFNVFRFEDFTDRNAKPIPFSRRDYYKIAYSLGFDEPTHFNNFFRKHLNTSPTKFRND
jgi:AraC family transcriptional activator of pobA